jgi:hypothetical protein
MTVLERKAVVYKQWVHWCRLDAEDICIPATSDQRRAMNHQEVPRACDQQVSALPPEMPRPERKAGAR